MDNMLYDLSSITTLEELFMFVDEVSFFGEITLFAIFITSFILIKQRYSILETVATSSFLAFIISIVYYMIGIVSYYYVSLFVILTAVSILLMYLKE